MAYAVYSNTTRVQRWLDTLGDAKLQELAQIDRAYFEAPNGSDEEKTAKEIAKDWIEDHGGSRDWWGLIWHR